MPQSCERVAYLLASCAFKERGFNAWIWTAVVGAMY